MINVKKTKTIITIKYNKTKKNNKINNKNNINKN